MGHFKNVVVFHVYDRKTELNFSFDSTPRKFIDVETGEEINLFAENTQEFYQKKIQEYFKMVENSTLHYLKNTVQADIKEVKIKLVVESIDTGKSRVYYN